MLALRNCLLNLVEDYIVAVALLVTLGSEIFPLLVGLTVSSDPPSQHHRRRHLP